MEIKDFLKQHRRAFECSDGQRKFRAMDFMANLKEEQAPGSPKGTQWLPSCSHVFQVWGSPQAAPTGFPP